uniref:Protein phosphatase 1 regulatory subunit n=1 Tax=Electrophorus electricus TaxID=8005 RepID=A0A4W4G1I1_ELEEL
MPDQVLHETSITRYPEPHARRCCRRHATMQTEPGAPPPPLLLLRSLPPPSPPRPEPSITCICPRTASQGAHGRRGMKMADAKQKRNEQLKRWLGSETDMEPPVLRSKKPRVKFDDGAVFLAACSSGDADEVLRLIGRGADVNYANVDGLTALHQACIDDNVDMVTFLVEHGACINQPDNEGWIPLHAAASCGYMDIAEYLISQGANVGVVNSEGETPLDIAEEEAMEELLQNEINRQGVDIEAARKEEERVMLRDARQWLNSGQITDVRHTKSGGTAMHVAAAKGYTEVLKLLIQAGYDVNIKDYDGWTPLHAAAHWGKEEACRILVDHMCDMDVVNKVGQTAFDVADEDVLGYLEELQKKQNLLLSEKKDVKKSPLIETTTTGDNNHSVKPVKSETLLLEPEKNAPRIDTLEPEKVDEEEEGKKDESSCSSEEEEEEDSESENEADKAKSSTPMSNSNSMVPAPAPTPTPAPTPSSVAVCSPSSPTNQVTTPTSPVKKVGVPAGKVSPKEDERKDESPASWRLGLRKTGSYGALAEISATKEGQKEKEATGVMRSASSPRLTSSLDNKDKEKEKEKSRLAYVAPTIPRRLASTSDIDEKENRDSVTSLVRSGSYTRRRWDEDLKNSDGDTPQNRTSSYQHSTSHTFMLGRGGSARVDLPAKSSSASSLEPNSCSTKAWQPPSSYQPYSIHRSGSFGRRQDDAVTSTTTTTSTTSTITSPTGHRSLFSRYWSEDSAEKEKESATVIPTINTAATTTCTTGTALGSDGRERRRSYLTPVRDEESESQRKARSRQARQSRRSTQGVTLTDLQEAEKTIGRSRVSRPREEEKEEREKQDKEKQEEKKEVESKEDDYRSRYRSLEEVRRGCRFCALHLAPSDKKEEEKEGEDRSQPRSIRDRRRPREKRRSTGVSFRTLDVSSLHTDTTHHTYIHARAHSSDARCDLAGASSLDRYEHLDSRGHREGRRPYSRNDRDDATDYKKLYEQILAENEKLKSQLRDADLELADLKLQLEKATQRQERFADRSQLEMEKRVRILLHTLMLPDLKADNQRLKDENGALIRVISKLSK